MAEAIAGVHFDISAETAKLQEGVKKAQAVLRQFGKSGERDGKLVGDAISAALVRVGGMVTAAFGVQSIVQFTVESLHAAAALGRLSDQAGLTVQQFQGLDFALRDARVPQEQLAQGFAIFSRNLSDLKRNTGPLADFFRRFAPEMGAQLKSTNGTAQAFGDLADMVGSLGNEYDRVRLLQIAFGDQGAKLAIAMRQGRAAIEEQARSFQGLNSEAVRRAQDTERAWDELWRHITLQAQRAAVSIASALDIRPTNLGTIEGVERALGQLEHRIRSGLGINREAQAEYDRLTQRLKDLKNAADAARDAESSSQGPGAEPPKGFSDDRAKAAQGQLQLFMAQLNQLPSQADFVSGAFQQAWARMDAALAASNATAAQRQAARIQLIQQEAQVRQQALGNDMLLTEQRALREEEFRLRHQQGLLTDDELQRKLTTSHYEYNAALASLTEGWGLATDPMERYRLQVEKINAEVARTPELAGKAGEATNKAGLLMASSYAGAAGQIAGTLAQAFPKQKGFAIAAAVMNTAEGVTKALAQGGFLGFAMAAAVAAAGMAQIATIRSSNPGSSSGSVPSVGGGTAGGGQAAEAPQPTQMTTINLAPGRYSRDEMKDFAEQIIEFQRDGGEVFIR